MAIDLRPASDGLEDARQRMRHLARWNIEPVPMVAIGAQAALPDRLSEDARQRMARVSMQVLAIQMGHATAIGSSDRRHSLK
jgi:hypothetical protein